MKTLHILVIFVFLAFGLFETAHAQYGPLPSEQAAHSAALQQALAQAENTGDISIQNIQTLPPAIMVGQTFHINATLINNSPNSIFVGHGACEAPFSITFDTHVLVSTNNINCTLQIIEQKLNLGEKITATSPYIDLVYKATEAGTTNATVTFSYSIWDPATQSDIEKKISKSFLFTIYGNNTKPQCCGPAYVPPVLDSPLKQFKSGIPALDVKCNDGLQLILKAEDASPACVKPDAAQILIERGWATNVPQPNQITNTKTNDPFGITALIIYHPQLACLTPPSHSIPASMPSCPPNNFYLKINSNSTAYLLGYNICDDNSCAKNSDLSILLPINTPLYPNYQSIGLPVSLQWKYGDTVNIQLEVSPNTDNKTASLIDLGNSTIVP